ncbi:flavonoid 3'-monooxygenase-like [Andrographis paniculata]|uniref:flavonoid 3'-monooxygenase-like n=1 Tax=Andrographis paniculata TaxID=175694 RepID=UPI0021E8AA34|nr:flavonoid 3'-monooxygenase-like [Andrographis paniculata]
MTTPFVAFISLTTILGFLLHFLINKLRRSGGGLPLPPGPRPWPIIGNLFQLGTKPHQTLAAMARVHGPLMHLKLGLMHVVVASSSQVVEQFLKEHDANFLSRPPNASAKYILNNEDMVFRPYGSRWRWLRKICALHLFSNKALDHFTYVREKEVEILLKALSSTGPRPVHLGQMVNVCTTNALARVILGRRMVGNGEGGGDGTAEEFRGMVLELMLLSGVFSVGEYIPPLEAFDLQGLATKMRNLRKRFDIFLRSIIEQHNANGNRSQRMDGHVDLLSALISLKEGGGGGSGNAGTGDEAEVITDAEIKALFLNLFAAGTDTTSSTVEWTVAELIRHPKILALAQGELDAIVGRDRVVTEHDLGKLPFCQAIMKEAFRLHPPTPLSLPRIAHESCEVNGFLIPKGSTLLVNVWAIGRNPDLWTNPLEFQPERFLEGGERSNADVKGNDFELIPFGAGRRICPGVTLGIRMVQLLTTNLIHAFSFDLSDGRACQTLNMEESYGLTLQRAEPLMLHPKPRLAPLVYGAEAN